MHAPLVPTAPGVAVAPSAPAAGANAWTHLTAEATRRLRALPWPRLYAMLAEIVAAVALLEVAYASAPMPPGVDPGDWITRSGAYVGLSVPPVSAFGNPYIYPPLLFPVLGSLLRAFGNPVTTGFVAGGLLLFLFGLSLIAVAFRFLRTGPAQVAFVGACMFSGTLLYMLFWGAYPNFFAFVFLDVMFVVLLSYARSGAARTGVLLGVVLALLYLAHSLTFAVGLVTVLVSAILVLLVAGPRFVWTRLWNRGLLAGVGILIATVVTYSEVLKFAHIVPPNYLGANPAALTLDNIGQFFVPLALGPMFLPSGPAVYFSTGTAMALLTGSAAALILAHSVVYHYRPRWVTIRHTVAVGTLVAALLTPVGGTLAGVGTVYSRFVYFLPVPIALVAAVTLDSVIAPWCAEASGASIRPSIRPRPPRRLPSPTGRTVAYVSVGVVLALMFANVAAPTTVRDEAGATGASHTSQFLAAADWLAADPQPGAVLTLEGDARWTEALTLRGAFDAGPTWDDFEPWQIVNSEEAFWALNSVYAATDGTAVESYGSNDTALLSQSPMYSVFIDNVVFPVVRLLPGAITVSGTGPGGGFVTTGAGLGTPVLAVNPTSGVGSILYTTPAFALEVVGTLGAPGSATVNVTVLPASEYRISELELAFASPPAGVALLHAPSSQLVYPTRTGFSWVSTDSLGTLPTAAIVNTTGSFTPRPNATSTALLPANLTFFADFEVPANSSPFSVSLTLSTPGASNPGVTLPRVLATASFLSEDDIRFLLMPTGNTYGPTIAFFQAVFGYTTVYSNSQWEVLEAA